MDRDDQLFRALASRARRQLLDRLRERNGQTLGQLCEGLSMARQSATQHLDVLEAANLVSAVRRGRERRHYLNPVPIHELQERWIDRFEVPRLRALRSVKQRAEEEAMADVPAYVYVIFIESTPERVWHALTDAELTGAFWGHHNVSDWDVGSHWEHVRTDGSGIADVVGTVLRSEPPRLLELTFVAPNDPRKRAPATVLFEIEPYKDIVKVTVTNDGLSSVEDRDNVANGWPAVLSNLKSLLETGRVLAQPPWEMHAEERAAQMARNDPT